MLRRAPVPQTRSQYSEFRMGITENKNVSREGREAANPPLADFQEYKEEYRK